MEQTNTPIALTHSQMVGYLMMLSTEMLMATPPRTLMADACAQAAGYMMVAQPLLGLTSNKGKTE